MSDITLVSVIVPVYNVEDFVGKCLKSITQQSYENLDIVVVDDGSTDGSGRICDEFAKNDKRITVFHKENGGLSDARNFGIKKAKGELIAFIDSDDWVKKDYISVMYRAMNRADTDIAICGYNNVKPQEATMGGEDATVKLLTKQENIDIVAWNKLYKKSLFVENEIYFPVGKKHEDALTTYKILAKARKVTYVSQSLYEYIKRKNSIMSEGKIEKRLLMREVAANEAVKYFSNNVDLKQAAEISLLLAEYALLDFAISGKIDKKYGEAATKWIKENRKEFNDNKYLTSKLKVYNLMSTKLGGGMYWIFRKIVHE